MSNEGTEAVLSQILKQLGALTVAQRDLSAKVAALQDPSVTADSTGPSSPPTKTPSASSTLPSDPAESLLATAAPTLSGPPTTGSSKPGEELAAQKAKAEAEAKAKSIISHYPSRILLTTYPDQHSIRPYPLNWEAFTASALSTLSLAQAAKLRGPIIPSRHVSSIARRNALGAHSGSYSIYRALSIALGSLDPSHKPNYESTGAPTGWEFDIPQPGWSRVVSFDPLGHVVPQVFGDVIKSTEEGGEGLDVRPSIAITKAHIKLAEIDEEVRRGELAVDGHILVWSAGGGPPADTNAAQPTAGGANGVEILVGKAAIEPVWYLPGIAERFGIPENLLRRSLFEDTGGMYPELITRPDIKVFLPPIGGLTAYIFGDPAYLSDESKYLTLRVHDECNGSDVFGSDICTCKPYLTYAISECVKTAQKGGVGVVVYFRKEGRALGEVTKYLVYNLRKRGGDTADKYFRSTELVAGVKDMRFQALMPDVLHWLGITKIDGMVSMSDMKYDAIVGSGIKILRRYDIPDHLIPPDSRVEIDAKIAAGYFSSGKQVTEEDLVKTVGRRWEETEH